MIKMFQVDAFTDKVFGGNPAAVCLLDKAIDTELMQKIAYENNLSETAFIQKKSSNYSIRWFTPTVEIDLCGHATLASAHVVFTETKHKSNTISFKSNDHGILIVEKKEDSYTLNFPKDPPVKIDMLSILRNLLGKDFVDLYRSKHDFIALFKDEDAIRNFIPDLDLIKDLEANGLVVTAPGKDVDFVSRFFAPRIGIDEDPVTGAIHNALIPLWAKRLGKTVMTARQLSKREGYLECELTVKNVRISGKAVTFAQGHILI